MSHKLIVCGLNGAGKSTIVRPLAGKQGIHRYKKLLPFGKRSREMDSRERCMRRSLLYSSAVSPCRSSGRRSVHAAVPSTSKSA